MWEDVVGEYRGEHSDVAEHHFGFESESGEQVGECVFGGGEHGERAVAAEGLVQAGGLHRGHQRRELAGRDRHVHDRSGRIGVPWRGREEDFVDDVDDAVGGLYVGGDHVGVVDHHCGAVDGDGDVGSVDGGDALAV